MSQARYNDGSATEKWYHYMSWDTMTSMPYTGNPTPVVVLKDSSWPSDAVLLALSAELNASETSFLLPKTDAVYGIRWFTPAHEEQFCGHGAVGAALTLNLETKLSRFTLEPARSSAIDVEISNDPQDGHARALLRFAEDPVIQRVPEHEKRLFATVLNLDPSELTYVGRNKINDVIIELDAARDFSAASMHIDPKAILKASAPGTRSQVITSKGKDGADFFKRVFAFGDEDQATGSTYAALTPYWGAKLGKTDLVGRQISRRGGEAKLHWAKDEGMVTVYAKGVIIGYGRLRDPSPWLPQQTIKANL